MTNNCSKPSDIWFLIGCLFCLNTPLENPGYKWHYKHMLYAGEVYQAWAILKLYTISSAQFETTVLDLGFWRCFSFMLRAGLTSWATSEYWSWFLVVVIWSQDTQRMLPRPSLPSPCRLCQAEGVFLWRPPILRSIRAPKTQQTATLVLSPHRVCALLSIILVPP